MDNHRRDWLCRRMFTLGDVFAIDCYSTSLMSNHMHHTLRNYPELVASWEDVEVAYRWCLIHRTAADLRALGPTSVVPPTPEEIDRILERPSYLDLIRRRLGSISWYMKELKEPLARLANREDHCTGAFFSERFHVTRILDSVGLNRANAYIDLNPVTAEVVRDPVMARYTSLEFHLMRLSADASVATSMLDEWHAILTDYHEGVDVAGRLAAFVRRLDEVRLGPAVPARRLPYTTPTHPESVDPPAVHPEVRTRDDVGSIGGPVAPTTTEAPQSGPHDSTVTRHPMAPSLGDRIREIRVLGLTYSTLEALKDASHLEREHAVRDVLQRLADADRAPVLDHIVATSSEMEGSTSEAALLAFTEMLARPPGRGTALGSRENLAAYARELGLARVSTPLAIAGRSMVTSAERARGPRDPDP